MSDNSENKQKSVEIDLGAGDAPAPDPAQASKPDGTDQPDPAQANGLPAAVPPTPEERIASLEAEKAEFRDRMLRIAADFDNWKKRARKEQGDLETRAREGVLRDILEVADNLERAMASFGDGKQVDAASVHEGVEMVLRQFRSKLERYQVKPVEAVGQAFDPRFHEAIAQMPTADVKPGSILRELQKGYLIGERLLRPAMVVVATAPPAPSPTDAAAREEPPAPAKPASSEGKD
jgi:molecular chaperone GrpE